MNHELADGWVLFVPHIPEGRIAKFIQNMERVINTWSAKLVGITYQEPAPYTLQKHTADDDIIIRFQADDPQAEATRLIALWNAKL